mgnify:CR=1 FL=1
MYTDQDLSPMPTSTKIFISLLLRYFVTFFSETKGNFINDVRDKFGNSDKSYSVKMKSVTKDTKNSESNEKKSQKEKKKAGYW